MDGLLAKSFADRFCILQGMCLVPLHCEYRGRSVEDFMAEVEKEAVSLAGHVTNQENERSIEI
jgi:hypothetical protein